MKKYKIRKRKKYLSSYYIFIIFAISTLFVSSGYALLSDTQKITGKANILSEEEGEVEIGNSTYSWYQRYCWLNSEGSWTYDIPLSITNLDEDYYSSLEISFDVDESFLLEESGTCNVWQVETVTFSGKTITLHFKETAVYLPVGTTETYYLQLKFANEIEFSMTNLVINGKLATYVASET